MNPTAAAPPVHAAAAAYAGGFLAGLNGRWHQRALWAFTAIVLAHWAEHLLQAWQIWGMGMERHHAMGGLGMLWPWLVHSEWLHYGYAAVMLAGLAALLPGMTGRARSWWLLALGLQFWHHVEHALLLAQSLTRWRLGPGAAPVSLVQLVVPRVELHLFYNAVVFAPMAVAVLFHLFPSPAEAAAVRCSCALRRAPAT